MLPRGVKNLGCGTLTSLEESGEDNRPARFFRYGVDYAPKVVYDRFTL